MDEHIHVMPLLCYPRIFNIQITDFNEFLERGDVPPRSSKQIWKPRHESTNVRGLSPFCRKLDKSCVEACGIDGGSYTSIQWHVKIVPRGILGRLLLIMRAVMARAATPASNNTQLVLRLVFGKITFFCI